MIIVILRFFVSGSCGTGDLKEWDGEIHTLTDHASFGAPFKDWLLDWRDINYPLPRCWTVFNTNVKPSKRTKKK